MADQSRETDAPDVEAIVGDIRRSIREAEEAYEKGTPPPDASAQAHLEAATRAQNNLYDNLHAANTTCRIGTVPDAPALIRGRLQRRVGVILNPLIGELNEHNAHVVRVLNKIVRILDGHDTEIASELLMKTQRRVDLLTQLCDRLSKYDDLEIEKRLLKLEEEAAKNRPRREP